MERSKGCATRSTFKDVTRLSFLIVRVVREAFTSVLSRVANRQSTVSKTMFVREEVHVRESSQRNRRVEAG